MTGISATSMRHMGMNAEAMKEAVLCNMGIGQQYRIKSTHEGYGVVKCTLVELSNKVAVFEHKNGTRESFQYSELWNQMMSGAVG